MSYQTLWIFFLADLAICLTPGPATAITASFAASGGMRASLGPIAGIHIGNFIWYALSAFGLVALITTAPDLYAAIRWGGVIYLLWMGWRMIASVNSGSQDIKQRKNTTFLFGFSSGLAVHMSNPKALLFYASFLPQFIDTNIDITTQILIFALITIVTESIGLLFYAYSATMFQKITTGKFANLSFDKIAGGVLIIVAIIMATSNAWHLFD